MDKKLKRLKNIALTAAEKNAIRQWLLAFIENTPAETKSAPVPAGIFAWRPIPALLVIAFLLAGGGVALAAERALPGDALFPVKLAVNDRVRGALAVSTAAQARLDAKLAERRLAEAEQVAAVGKLDADAKAAVEADFNRHAKAASREINRLNERGDAQAAADISSDLEAGLQAHGAILTALGAKHDSAAVAPLVEKVQTHFRAVKQKREQAENELITKENNPAPAVAVPELSQPPEPEKKNDGGARDEATERSARRLDKEVKLLEKAQAEFKTEIKLGR